MAINVPLGQFSFAQIAREVWGSNYLMRSGPFRCQVNSALYRLFFDLEEPDVLQLSAKHVIASDCVDVLIKPPSDKVAPAVRLR